MIPSGVILANIPLLYTQVLLAALVQLAALVVLVFGVLAI
jgi:hypothetical protein